MPIGFGMAVAIVRASRHKAPPQFLCGDRGGKDKAMTIMNNTTLRSLFPRQAATLVLAASMGLPAMAQQAQPSSTPDSNAAQQTQSSTYVPPPKEGFWGHLNPFARKKWVKKQLDPVRDQLSELDQVNAKNARDIQDVDSRAQSGIHKAQSDADAANQAALAAGDQAKQAGATAQNASTRVGQLNSTVSGLDQYKQVTDAEIRFHSSYPALTAEARKQLDDLAAGLTGRDGYILELSAHSPAAGSAGIQNSQRLAEAVERYLVTEHQIPIYRMHAVALGNVQTAAAGENSRPARVNLVHVRVMENSLAAQEAALPHGAPSSGSAEQP